MINRVAAMIRLSVTLFVFVSCLAHGAAVPDSDVVMRAMVDELRRSVKGLVLEDLPQPYFIQLNAHDRSTFSMAAAYGGLLRSDVRRMRTIGSRVRVGSYRLDNTNFGRSLGAAGLLPLDDDYTALRHAIWLILDRDYKQAVEALAAKRAYLKEKNVEDRPDDFAPAEPTKAVEGKDSLCPSPAMLVFDRKAWEGHLKVLSARFKKHPKIQNSKVTLFAGTVNEWIVNSEGTRLRTGDSGVVIEINAEVQAQDGMPLSDRRTYIGETIDQLPPIQKMLADIDELCSQLIALREAPRLEHYTGPVLCEPVAAGKVFASLLGDRLCARPVPLGSGGWGDRSLEKKIGLRILPRSFQVYDDPRPKSFEGTLLAGAYIHDDEAVPASRVDLVQNGVLKNLVAGRAPTRKTKKSTGHGRSGGFGDPQASIACMYILDNRGVSADELKQKLIGTARDEGLGFALRIESMNSGGVGSLGDPIHAYKVYVEDGREEPVRGLEFLPVQTRSVKRILAGGTERRVHNAISRVSSSIVAPAVIFEELELSEIEREFDKLPILKSPQTREPRRSLRSTAR